MDRSFHILILEEDGAITQLLTDALPREGLRFYLHHTATESEFRRQLRAFDPDLIVASHAPPRCDGLAALAAVRRKGIRLPFILACATQDEATALEGLRQGATDYVLRERLAQLGRLVPRVLRQTEESFPGQQGAPTPDVQASPLLPPPDPSPSNAEENISADWLDLAHDAILARHLDGADDYRVEISLPAAVMVGAVEQAAEASHLPRGKGELVLLVDDEDAVRNVASQILRLCGYKVVTASDAAQAVESSGWRAREIAVVVLDMMMPAMDGPGTINALSRLNGDIKVIAAGGFDGEAHFSKTSNLPVMARLHKPYTAAALLQTLHDVLRPGGKR